MISSSPTANGQGCPEHGVVAYPHPELCDHFYLCTNGTLTEEVCENGLLFDGKGAVHNHCNYHWAVDCGVRKYQRKCATLTIVAIVRQKMGNGWVF